MTPRASIVVPVYNEGEAIVGFLDRLLGSVKTPCEVLVVYDSPEDSTAPYLEKYAVEEDRLKPLHNTYGRGPANAIKFGVDSATAPVVVVTMSDGSDDSSQIDQLIALIEGGAAVAAASRYVRGGRQRGGPMFKKLLSRLAGSSLFWLARTGTHDATSAFKAYSANFIKTVGIDSDAGFEMAIEMVAKARRLRLPVTEIPTTWTDRTVGESNFKLAAWLPRYIRWYRFAFGPKLTVEELGQRATWSR